MRNPANGINFQKTHFSESAVTYRILLVMVIVLDRKSRWRDDPTATNRHLLRIVRAPNLNL